jgi:hypothetical protein
MYAKNLNPWFSPIASSGTAKCDGCMENFSALVIKRKKTLSIYLYVLRISSRSNPKNIVLEECQAFVVI